ncbi:MAG: hypothetical protein PWP45_1206 [Tepidanaerobacteraceae bacterium]|nr:hypothetical protein [Tepidanaerobacteraceae bacterium]
MASFFGSKPGRNSERGQALVLVLLVLAVVMILSAATLTLTSSHRLSVSKLSDRMQALYTAEAGVERALAMIKNNPGLLEEILQDAHLLISDELYLERGEKKSYIKSVTVERVDDTDGEKLKITSVGTFGNARKEIIAVIRYFYEYAYFLKGISILPEEDGSTIDFRGKFNLTASRETRPSIFVKGGINLTGSAKIIGFDIYTSGDIQYDDKNLQDCSLHPYYENIPEFPELDRDWYEKKARESGQYFEDKDKDNVELPDEIESDGGRKRKDGEYTEYSGVIFVEGNLNISGNYKGQAVIVAMGDINVTGDLLAENKETDMLVLISFGDVDINNNNVDALVIANNVFRAHGNAKLYGGIVTRDMDVNGNVDIFVDPSLVEKHGELMELAFGEGGGSTRIEIESWSEH